LKVALAAIEAGFSDSVRVSKIQLVLIPGNKSYLLQDSQFLRPLDLRLEIAVRWNPDNQTASIQDLTRSAAHEIYHMALRSLRPRHLTRGTLEETDAAIFESCIEQATFGTIRTQAFDQASQSDPEAFASLDGPYLSAAGNLEATRRLATIAGPDLKISSPREEREFEALCASLAR
jgi:hypothetical protein